MYRIRKRKGVPEHNLSERTQPVRHIVIHYTDGTGSAQNNVDYFRGGDRNASADFFIDSKSIWRFNPNCAKYYSWHCGDGHGAFGIFNSTSIGIEVVSAGEDFTKGEQKRLRYLVKKLMKKYSIDKKHVVRHYDASRKECPKPYIAEAKWKKLRDYITS